MLEHPSYSTDLVPCDFLIPVAEKNSLPENTQRGLTLVLRFFYG